MSSVPPHPLRLAAALACASLVLSTGCASLFRSTPHTEGTFVEEPEPTEPVATTVSTNDVTAVPDQSPAPQPPVEATPAAPVLAPKPWSVVLERGSRKALLDGVTVWMSEPATNGTSTTPRASWTDRRTTLDPILLAPTNSLTNGRAFRVMIDPGHGGADPGALARDGKQRESAHTMDIARRLSTYLTRAGYDVRMTRTDDKTFVPLEDRPAMAAAWRADAFVSIHLNAASDASATGLETYVVPPPGVRATSQLDAPSLSPNAWAAIRKTYPGNARNIENLRLAFCIQRRLLKTTGYADRGIRRARFTVLRDAETPATLVEAGFLSNRQDAAFLATPSGRERIARGLYQGIVDYALGHVAPGFPTPQVVPATPPKLVVP